MGHAGEHILLVDDEPSLLKMMSAYLSRLGYTVSAVNSTAKAWAEVQAAPETFSIAVLDATMPGLTMEELALKILDASPSMQVLAASGYPVDMTTLEVFAPGRVAFLHKPFGPEALATAVRRMLGPKEESI